MFKDVDISDIVPLSFGSIKSTMSIRDMYKEDKMTTYLRIEVSIKYMIVYRNRYI